VGTGSRPSSPGEIKSSVVRSSCLPGISCAAIAEGKLADIFELVADHFEAGVSGRPKYRKNPGFAPAIPGTGDDLVLLEPVRLVKGGASPESPGPAFRQPISRPRRSERRDLAVWPGGDGGRARGQHLRHGARVTRRAHNAIFASAGEATFDRGADLVRCSRALRPTFQNVAALAPAQFIHGAAGTTSRRCLRNASSIPSGSRRGDHRTQSDMVMPTPLPWGSAHTGY